MGFLEDIGKGVGQTINVQKMAGDLFDNIKPWAEKQFDEKIWPWAEQKIDEVVDKYTPVVIEKLLAMLPTVAAAAAKVAVEKMIEGIPNLPNFKLPDVGHIAGEVVDAIVDSDPDIQGLSDIIDLSELFRKWREGHA